MEKQEKVAIEYRRDIVVEVYGLNIGEWRHEAHGMQLYKVMNDVILVYSRPCMFYKGVSLCRQVN